MLHRFPPIDRQASELDAVLAAAGRHHRKDYPTAFAAALAAAAGARHGCVVSSDSGAVSTLVGALGLAPGDRVLVAAHLRMRFVFALLFAGLVPVFVDCLREDLTLDADALAEHRDGDVRAAVLALPWGVSSDLPAVRAALAPAGCPLVLDVTDCLSPGLARSGLAQAADVLVAALGEGHSPLSTGEGGAILSDDEALVERAAHYQRFSDLEGLRLGINMKISSMQAALGLHRLAGWDAAWEDVRAAARDIAHALGAAGLEPGPSSTFGTFLSVRLAPGDDAADALGAVAATQRLPQAHRLAAAGAHARPCPRLDGLARTLRAVALRPRGDAHA